MFLPDVCATPLFVLFYAFSPSLLEASEKAAEITCGGRLSCLTTIPGIFVITNIDRDFR